MIETFSSGTKTPNKESNKQYQNFGMPRLRITRME